jgi:hypothetical protein
MNMAALFKRPKLPEQKPVASMPDPDSPEAAAAKRRAMEAARSRSGRASTVLSGDYSKDKLGTS